MVINQCIKAVRVSWGWTQKYVADHAGIGRTTYMRIEQGIQQPHEDTIKRLCSLFQASPEQLGFSLKKRKKEQK